MPGPRPQTISHRAENRSPNVGFDIGAKVFIEAFSWATLEATDPEGFLNAEMVFELLLVFDGGAGEDLGCPIHRFFAVFFVLCEARVRPIFGIDGSYVLFSASFDGSARFPDVDGIGAAFAMEFVDAFTFAWRRPGFVFGAEHILEFVTSLG